MRGGCVIAFEGVVYAHGALVAHSSLVGSNLI